MAERTANLELDENAIIERKKVNRKKIFFLIQ